MRSVMYMSQNGSRLDDCYFWWKKQVKDNHWNRGKLQLIDTFMYLSALIILLKTE
jgi:hypothetical protein